MGIYIYKQYYNIRNRMSEGKIQLKNAKQKEREHKFKICLEVLLNFIHEGNEDKEGIDITQLKPDQFIEWYKTKLGKKKFYEIMLYIQKRVGTYI